ncbi:MAG: bacillithiol biosynthesis cysteine-adding enzyme BshC [Acidobacteriota bacterium]
MTANASSFSATSRSDGLRVELAGSGLLPAMPRAFLEGRERDLLAPLRFLPPGELPAPRPQPAPDRRALAEALRVANRAYGNRRADELADLLARPETRVVVTGQQPGILGGPLYTLSKAVAAARWAAALEAAGQPAVAVFWVATEDHDFREVSALTVLARGGSRKLSLGEDPEPLAPVGMRTLGRGIEAVLAELAELMPGDRYGRWLDEIRHWYRPEARFGEAFCRLMSGLLGDYSPLFLDAMDADIKRLQRPWLEKIVERRAEVAAASAAADERIVERGFALQVSPQPGTSPLFLLHRGERRRIEWTAEGYRLRGGDDAGGSIAELLEIVRDNPAVVSPGVLARPAIQDALLASDLQLLGPGELSYMPQVAALYPVLGITAPWTTLRPQAMVVEGHQLEHLEELSLPLESLLGDRRSLDRKLSELGGGDLLAAPRQRVEAILAEVGTAALAVDGNLERPFDKTREQILRALDKFSDKVAAAAVRSDEVRSRRIDRLREALLPDGRMQERVVFSAHFRGKHEQRFVDSLWQQMDLDGGVLQVITP